MSSGGDAKAKIREMMETRVAVFKHVPLSRRRGVGSNVDRGPLVSRRTVD